MKLNFPWTANERASYGRHGGRVVVSDAAGDVACTVPFDPSTPGDEDVARFTAKTICDRVNAGERVPR